MPPRRAAAAAKPSATQAEPKRATKARRGAVVSRSQRSRNSAKEKQSRQEKEIPECLDDESEICFHVPCQRLSIAKKNASNLGVQSTETQVEMRLESDIQDEILFAQSTVPENTEQWLDSEKIDLTNRVDYLNAANPKGKSRAVGAPKRNRKEQMSVQDQIEAGKKLAQAMGVVRCTDAASADEEKLQDGDNEDANNATDLECPPSPPPSDCCIDGNTSSDTAVTSAASRRMSNQRKRKRFSFMVSPSLSKQRQRESEVNYVAATFMQQPCTDASQLEVNSKDSKSIVVRRTSSDDLKPYNYDVFDKTQHFDDETFETWQKDAVELSESAVRNCGDRIAASENCSAEEGIERARTMLSNSGYGCAAITMEDFDVTRTAAAQNQDAGEIRAHKDCCYPIKSNLRCRYDHHCFDSIPILLPLRWHESKNILEVQPDVVFCSFGCALAYLQRDVPRLHHNVRNDRVSLLRFMARKWFGITERIRPAPLLQQQQEYGGCLSIEQFRRLSTTHQSFIEYPLAAAVPARYITEIVVAARIDRAKRQGMHLRVAEQHGDQVPDPPAALEIDPSAPAAPRGAEARARAAQAKEARKRKLGAAGIEVPDKKRTVTTESGERQTIDRAYVDQVIQRTAERQRAKPVRKHAMDHLLIKKKKP